MPIIAISRSVHRAQEAADELEERNELEILARRYGQQADPEQGNY